MSTPIVYFADAYAKRLEASATLPAKFQRLLSLLPLAEMVDGKNVALKMHMGGHLGYTTIHPLFVHILVKALRDAGGNVFACDSSGAVRGAKVRGYTEETIGCPLVPVGGLFDKYFYSRPVDYLTLKEIQVAGHIHDADVFVDFSHVKGHGACGYGGACKNIAMGCVTGKTRSDIHALEGGLKWDESKCVRCNMCIDACRYGAARFDGAGKFNIFYHHCVYCQHCANACPEHAISLNPSGFTDFQEGMAICTREVLAGYEPGRQLFINILTNITMLCDCWGFSTKPIVPDIGIMASTDIVAIEQASLDSIREENFLNDSLPEGRELREGKHLLERIHAKDPFVQLAALETHGLGSRKYELATVE